MILRASGPKAILLRPVHPSAAERDWLRSQIEGMVDAMHQSVMFWVNVAWRKGRLAEDIVFTQGELAMDLSPSKILSEAIERLAKQWTQTFDKSSKSIAQGFADKTLRHHDLAFAKALRDAGFSVKFQMTQAVRDAVEESIWDLKTGSVSLIKSIPKEYLDGVRKKVSESVAGGRNLKQLTHDLEHVFHSTHERATLIARDQNNKATASIHKARQKELGITKAEWVHSGASGHPRPEHEAWGAEGARYDIEQGMWSEEDGEFVWPGTPINCGCVCLSVVPGLEDLDETETETAEETA